MPGLLDRLSFLNLQMLNVSECWLEHKTFRDGNQGRWAERASLNFASSEESVGDVRLRQSAKCVIQRDFRDVEGAEAVGFSHRQFGLVVETLDHAAGELLSGAEVVQDQRTMRA